MSHRGPISRLDGLEAGRHVSALHHLVHEIVTAEGPVSVTRTAALVAQCHGLSRLTGVRQEQIAAHLPTDLIRDEQDGFLWPATRHPLSWRGFRVWDGPLKDRPLEEIALHELANGAAAVTRASMGIELDDLLRETLRLFGGSRLTEGARSRLAAAVELAARCGLLRIADELVEPAD